MTTQVKYRRGTDSEHSAFIGADGEISVVTDDHGLRVHDNVTPGGWEINHRTFPEELENKIIDLSKNDIAIDISDITGLGNYLAKDVEDTYTPKYLNLSHGSAVLCFDEQTAPDDRGIKRITCNDGGGNWNFRAGNYYNSGNKYTGAGDGATHMYLSCDGTVGHWRVSVAETANAADDDITWANTAYLKTDKFYTSNDLEVGGNINVDGDINIGSVGIGSYDSSRTDITSLVPGTTKGTLIESPSNAHVVVGVKTNDVNDSFSVIGEQTNTSSNGLYDKLLFQVKADGTVNIPGTLVIDGQALNTDGFVTKDGAGNVNVTGTLTVGGTTFNPGSYLKSNANDTFSGKLSVSSTTARRAGIYGIYDSTKIGHVWSMGTSYAIAADGSNFGNLYGLAYGHNNNAAVSSGSGITNHQIMWVHNGTPRSSLGTNIWCSSDIIAFSDKRVKDNIEKIDNAVDKVQQLNGYTFTRTDQDDPNKRYTGVIAQEVQEVLPEAVSSNNEGMLSVAYGNMVGLLIEAMKEQQETIDRQAAQISELQVEVSKLIKG